MYAIQAFVELFGDRWEGVGGKILIRLPNWTGEASTFLAPSYFQGQGKAFQYYLDRVLCTRQAWHTLTLRPT